VKLPIKVDEATGVAPILVVVIAKREYGKTTLAIALQPHLAPKDRIILVDPQGTLASETGIPRHRIEPNEDSTREFLEKVLRPAEEEGHGHFLMIDEGDRFMTTRSVVGGQQGVFFELINVSRGWGMGAMLISHGAGVTSKNVLEQADIAFLGNTTETNALRYWRSYFGDTNYVEFLRRLPPHHFAVWCNSLAPNQFQGVVTVENGQLVSVSEEELRERMGGAAPEPEEDTSEERDIREPDPEEIPPGRPPELNGS
jgi:hypothetical protein